MFRRLSLNSRECLEFSFDSFELYDNLGVMIGKFNLSHMLTQQPQTESRLSRDFLAHSCLQVGILQSVIFSWIYKKIKMKK